MTGRKADLIHSIEPSCPKKRGSALRESEDEAHESKASEAYGITPSATQSPSSGPVPNESAVLWVDSSPEREQQKRKVAVNEHGTSKKPRGGSEFMTERKDASVKDKPLSTDIMDHIILRVKADGPSIKARGSIEVGFEDYKTAERLFTSLMSERSLKSDMQKKVSELTATVNGKETCCRRTHFEDWASVCRELRKLWDNSPQLFDDRFQVDVMLHIDE